VVTRSYRFRIPLAIRPSFARAAASRVAARHGVPFGCAGTRHGFEFLRYYPALEGEKT
jgi:hypothetical protein